MSKMTFSSVQELASERRNTLNKALRVLTENYPSSESGETASKPMKEFKKIVNDFFLTDHVYEDDSDSFTDRAIMADASVDSLDCTRNNRAVIMTTSTDDSGADASKGDEISNLRSSKKSKSPSQTPKLKIKKKIGKKTIKKGDGTAVDSSRSALTSSMTISTRSPPMQNGNTVARGTNGVVPVESPVRPKSVRKRMSTRKRSNLRRELMKSKELSFHDSAIIAEKKGYLDSPYTVAGMVIGLMLFFLWLPRINITIELDAAVFLCFTLTMIGMSLAPENSPDHYVTTPVNSNRKRVDSETLMRKCLGNDTSKRLERKPTFLESIVSTATNNDTFETGKSLSPIKKFPDDAEIGSMFNCWSEPISSEFKVRGANYLRDKIKVASGPFLFPARGVDVFLSDCCPEHIAR